MADDPQAQRLAKESPEQIKAGHAFMMKNLRDMGVLAPATKAGLTEGSELPTEQDTEAGTGPAQNDNLATNDGSAPQADE